jgi:RNA polymerase sigma-70 factor (ECF subfamily)
VLTGVTPGNPAEVTPGNPAEVPPGNAAEVPPGNPTEVIGQPADVEGAPAPTDAAVIAASLLEPARFGEIFDRHFADVSRYLTRRVGASMADELAAETFVLAFRLRDRYDSGTGDARAWLFGIATNLMRRHWRRLRAYARTGVDPICDEVADLDRRIDSMAAAPQLAAALASLGRGEREVLLLFAWADLSYEEIAAALGIPGGTVRSRLSRARAHIRELLSPSGQVSVDGATEGGTSE